MLTFSSQLMFNLAAALAAPEAAGVHAEEHGGDKVFPPFDPTYFPTQIFWLLITFGLLYFVLSKIFLPRISETLEERSNRIADDLDSAARMQREAEQAVKNYERALADAKAKAHNVAETTRQSVEAEIAAETMAADAEAAKQAEKAELRIRKNRDAAMANIDDIAADVTQAAIEKLTGRKLSMASVRKAIKGV